MSIAEPCVSIIEVAERGSLIEAVCESGVSGKGVEAGDNGRGGGEAGVAREVTLELDELDASLAASLALILSSRVERGADGFVADSELEGEILLGPGLPER